MVQSGLPAREIVNFINVFNIENYLHRNRLDVITDDSGTENNLVLMYHSNPCIEVSAVFSY